MPGISRFVVGLAGLLCLGVPARAATPAELYQAQTIVTGTGDVNRQIGFKDCLDKVLVKVSGDQRLTQKTQMLALREKAADFVQSFRYHDRLEGIPIHDEQGTHDRPHDLTCLYKPAVVDKLLAQLGSRPWPGERPTIAVFMIAEQGARHFVLTQDEQRGNAMRESFANAAGPLLMRVTFPRAGQLGGLDEKALSEADMARLDKFAKKAGAARALAGSIVWSDKELGWIADWRLADRGKIYRWQARGVSFDEAFRVAIRGAAQILSGHGQP
ncbi:MULTISPECIES: DUF2066 domain-containing protein [unclassified Mesorhizobium]|uniref:DUF2066 domain-containing protein n=6 Tax=Mesorhizobium TaxID=68287 RepID=UPI000F75F098|nr:MULTISPECIES: DUF2066 domain-containing protein [unclassified Mesorhizobium]AZO06877.1 DUF2066 domain-containing protein [Mesorhizobium sp. M2A.F.Ca.ET.043.02.1.1]RUW38621.1 DUF2066 domain-containing protein [Mesorhizobium sp. M2A.F.Ca.ET.015.02.1.1]RUW64946.1 DUF2066 domain-containing protein [Mesorhizobium sp. M2A.F.Ca.ET.067.02.1.1]RVC94248.1 DUF2066 domain-containing protein [Mesorhizobium sp. M2A.F.Ca.ET.017.03.2.1]RWB37346.1 MAG: DUF2066 domain-containing protein [Mesorhizobium sp.]